MDVFAQKRFTHWIILLLVLLNVLVLASFWLSRERPKPAPAPSSPAGTQSTVKEFLQRELDLTPEQVTRYDALLAAHTARTKALEEEIHATRREMMDQLEKDQPDMALVDRLAAEIGAGQAALDKATFNHFLEIKAVCSPAQQARLNEIVREVLRALRPAGPPPTRQGQPRPDSDRPAGSEPPPQNDRPQAQAPPPRDGQPAEAPPPRREGQPDRQPPPDGRPPRRPPPPPDDWRMPPPPPDRP